MLPAGDGIFQTCNYMQMTEAFPSYQYFCCVLLPQTGQLQGKFSGVTLLTQCVHLAGFSLFYLFLNLFLFYFFYSLPQAMLVFAGGSLAVFNSEPAFLGGFLQRSPSIHSSVFHGALAPYFVLGSSLRLLPCSCSPELPLPLTPGALLI